MEKKQIYIVDDDESVCRALKYLLVSYGFEVETYGSAEKFFSSVPNSVKGVLIMDIHMPGVDGWEAQRRLVRSRSSRPIIIISADKNGGIKNEVFKAGAAGFLQKPVKAQELVDLINQVL